MILFSPLFSTVPGSSDLRVIYRAAPLELDPDFLRFRNTVDCMKPLSHSVGLPPSILPLCAGSISF